MVLPTALYPDNWLDGPGLDVLTNRNGIPIVMLPFRLHWVNVVCYNRHHRNRNGGKWLLRPEFSSVNPQGLTERELGAEIQGIHYS
jgi:hypothetical protein